MDIWSLTWLPPVIFSSIILFGFSIGYINGWKTGAYIFSWNILGILIAISTFIFVYPHLLNIVPDKNIRNLSIKDFIIINSNEAKPIFGLIYLIFILVLLNILAFNLYWLIPPLKKFLRREIKANKKNGFSSKGIRFVGAGIGTISFIPFAAFSTSITTIANNQFNNFTRINSRLVKGLTFGQYKNPEKLLQDIRSYILISQDDDLSRTISGIFGANDSNIPKKLNENQKHILETALNSKMFLATIKDPKLAKKFMGNKDLSKVDLAKTPKKLNASVTPYIKLENRDNLVDSIFKGIVPNTKNKNINKQQVKEYLKTLLDW